MQLSRARRQTYNIKNIQNNKRILVTTKYYLPNLATNFYFSTLSEVLFAYI